MPEPRIPSEPGVLFRREDCASVWRRFAAAVVDGTILLIATIVSALAWWFVLLGHEIAEWFWLGSTSVLWTLYLGVLKRSTLRTVGYRVAGIRVVALDGGVPGLWAMFVRSTTTLLWALTCSTLFVIDVLWIGQDEQRQTLRDKIAGTLVVRANAAPVATGIQTVRMYTFGWTLYLREVKAVAAVPATPPPHIA